MQACFYRLPFHSEKKVPLLNNSNCTSVSSTEHCLCENTGCICHYFACNSRVHVSVNAFVSDHNIFCAKNGRNVRPLRFCLGLFLSFIWETKHRNEVVLVSVSFCAMLMENCVSGSSRRKMHSSNCEGMLGALFTGRLIVQLRSWERLFLK